jgi:hypothetical protein
MQFEDWGLQIGVCPLETSLLTIVDCMVQRVVTSFEENTCVRTVQTAVFWDSLYTVKSHRKVDYERGNNRKILPDFVSFISVLLCQLNKRDN